MEAGINKVCVRIHTPAWYINITNIGENTEALKNLLQGFFGLVFNQLAGFKCKHAPAEVVKSGIKPHTLVVYSPILAIFLVIIWLGH